MKKFSLLFSIMLTLSIKSGAQIRISSPNIIVIYTDDLGYGDLSCYGATKVHTPNIDALAKQGIRFSNAHSGSATCTPSRFSLLTGKYAWRNQGTGIAPGDAALIIPTDIQTLPGMLQEKGYNTTVIGKWHLGLGPKGGPNWNGKITPGPLEIGFNYSFLIPATGDRVPTVFVENHHVTGLDPSDPITVNYNKKVGNDPIGKENPELLKLQTSPGQGHDNTIINGISRIGYMTGGNKARWRDEDFADILIGKAKAYFDINKGNPFFLYFSTHDIHVPRVPHERFAGKSDLGPRGDVIMQLDWTVGELVKTLDSLKLTHNTMIIFSSDNGPVLDDGYQDEAVAKLSGHTPTGRFRGGKYSSFEAGTRVPLIVTWPAGITQTGKESSALMSQLDLFASLAKLVGYKLKENDAPDSFNTLTALLGKSDKGRSYVIEHAGALSIIKGNWKYITPNNGSAISKLVNIELGNSSDPQLYDLKRDPAEQENLALKYPKLVKELSDQLEVIKNKEASRFEFSRR